jgi:hypothetical protein
MLRSVARRRLVEEEESYCVLNCELESVYISDSDILFVLSVIRELVTKMLINPIIRTRTRYFRHTYPLHVTIL